jgi:hypothetical protein
MLPVVLVIGILNPGTVLGQVGYTAPSLECVVADADVVVRGTTESVSRGEVVGGSALKLLTLDVTETLKGEGAKRLRFAVQAGGEEKTVEIWKEAGGETLWFLSRRKPAGTREEPNGEYPELLAFLDRHGTDLYTSLGWSATRLGPRGSEQERRSPPPPYLTLDLRPVATPDEILDAVRHAVAQEGKRKPVHHHNMDLIPRSIIERSGSSGDANRFIVPVDHRLNAAARRWIESPDDFLPPIDQYRKNDRGDHRMAEAWRRGDRHWLRLEGARALQFFKSDENTALLKSLLDDLETSVHTSGGGNEPEVKERVYDLREAAYGALRDWGVEVSKPVLREALPRE